MFAPIKCSSILFLSAIALIVVVVFGGAGTAVYAANISEPLFQVKPSIDQSLENTAVPTNVPASKVEITGTIEVINADSLTINGQVIQMTGLTEVKGTLAVGETVKVHAFVNADGTYLAHEVEVGRSGVDDSGSHDLNEDYSGNHLQASDDHGTSADIDNENDSHHGSNSDSSNDSSQDEHDNNHESHDQHSGDDTHQEDHHSGGDDSHH